MSHGGPALTRGRAFGVGRLRSMASGPPDDEDAFRWDGDDDRAPRAAGGGSETTPLPAGWHAVGKGSAEVPADGDADAEAAPLGSVALVTLGLLGGIYLLYTIGWIIGGGRMQEAAVFLVEPAAIVPALVVAVAAPALWFGTTLLLTRHRAVWLRLTWLIAGALLLVPWPFVMIGTVSG